MARATQEGRVNCVIYYKIDQKSSWHQGRPVGLRALGDA